MTVINGRYIECDDCGVRYDGRKSGGCPVCRLAERVESLE